MNDAISDRNSASVPAEIRGSLDVLPEVDDGAVRRCAVKLTVIELYSGTRSLASDVLPRFRAVEFAPNKFYIGAVHEVGTILVSTDEYTIMKLDIFAGG